LTSFAELDGGIPDGNQFVQSLTRVMGRRVENAQLSLPMYIAVREVYSRAVRTHPGGVRLYGQVKLREVIRIVKSEEEYTSPIAKIFKTAQEYIIMTENSIYIVDAGIPSKRIT
jgi:hypothetical protein